MSKLGQLRTCFRLTTTNQISCKSPPKELCISMTYLPQSILAMLIFPSNSLWRIFVLHYTVILQWMHISPLLLGLATMNYVVWHLFVDSWQVQQLPHLYPLLHCLELTTAYHCCLVLLMMWHPTCNGCRTVLLVLSCGLPKSFNIAYIPATLAPPHTPCLFSIDLQTVRQHLVVAPFILLLLLSGTLFLVMSGVSHYCHHLCLVWGHTCFAQFPRTELYPWSLNICACFGLVIDLLTDFLNNAIMCI